MEITTGGMLLSPQHRKTLPHNIGDIMDTIFKKDLTDKDVEWIEELLKV